MKLEPFLRATAETALPGNVFTVFANLSALLAYNPVLPDSARFALLITTHAVATLLTTGGFTGHALINTHPSSCGRHAAVKAGNGGVAGVR